MILYQNGFFLDLIEILVEFDSTAHDTCIIDDDKIHFNYIRHNIRNKLIPIKIKSLEKSSKQNIFQCALMILVTNNKYFDNKIWRCFFKFCYYWWTFFRIFECEWYNLFYVNGLKNLDVGLFEVWGQGYANGSNIKCIFEFKLWLKNIEYN